MHSLTASSPFTLALVLSVLGHGVAALLLIPGSVEPPMVGMEIGASAIVVSIERDGPGGPVSEATAKVDMQSSLGYGEEPHSHQTQETPEVSVFPFAVKLPPKPFEPRPEPPKRKKPVLKPQVSRAQDQERNDTLRSQGATATSTVTESTSTTFEGAMAGASRGVRSDASPSYFRNPPPVYPESARRMHHEGVVKLSVLVNVAGLPAEVSITESSGHDALDASALAAVSTWQFKPGAINGEPVSSRVDVPIRFSLSKR